MSPVLAEAPKRAVKFTTNENYKVTCGCVAVVTAVGVSVNFLYYLNKAVRPQYMITHHPVLNFTARFYFKIKTVICQVSVPLQRERVLVSDLIFKVLLHIEGRNLYNIEQSVEEDGYSSCGVNGGPFFYLGMTECSVNTPFEVVKVRMQVYTCLVSIHVTHYTAKQYL